MKEENILIFISLGGLFLNLAIVLFWAGTTYARLKGVERMEAANDRRITVVERTNERIAALEERIGALHSENRVRLDGIIQEVGKVRDRLERYLDSRHTEE